MSRSTGAFPFYTKIKVTEDDWPISFWDSSLKCIKCDKLWPTHELFNITPCCGASTRLTDDVPDMRWPDALKAYHTARFEKYYDEWNEGRTDEQLVMEDEIKELKSEEKELVLQGNK